VLKHLELTDKAAIAAMIERIIGAESNGSPNAKDEHLDETGVDGQAAYHAAGMMCRPIERSTRCVVTKHRVEDGDDVRITKLIRDPTTEAATGFQSGRGSAHDRIPITLIPSYKAAGVQGASRRRDRRVSLSKAAAQQARLTVLGVLRRRHERNRGQ
jgi:hypothetical protein